MTDGWEILDQPAAPQGAPLLDAVLTPNRSLSRQALKLVIGSFALMNLGVATVFWLHGAYPVSGFLGLDVVALAWAFRVNCLSGKVMERVLISRDRVQVTRRAPDRREVSWIASPLWIQVRVDPTAVRMRAGGGDLLVGGFLSPPERRSFAAALSAALAEARA